MTEISDTTLRAPERLVDIIGLSPSAWEKKPEFLLHLKKAIEMALIAEPTCSDECEAALALLNAVQCPPPRTPRDKFRDMLARDPVGLWVTVERTEVLSDGQTINSSKIEEIHTYLQKRIRIGGYEVEEAAQSTSKNPKMPRTKPPQNFDDLLSVMDSSRVDTSDRLLFLDGLSDALHLLLTRDEQADAGLARKQFFDAAMRLRDCVDACRPYFPGPMIDVVWDVIWCGTGTRLSVGRSEGAWESAKTGKRPPVESVLHQVNRQIEIDAGPSLRERIQIFNERFFRNLVAALGTPHA